MASGASLRPVMSNCTRCLQPHLRRNALPQSFSRTFHQSSRIYSAEAAASADDQRPTTGYTYSLPRTKVYEHTRPQPRAPVRHRGPGQEFKVNDDQTVLDEMYGRLLGVGPEGVNLLTPELRWQAVTHRSFDHARQPYNNKLAFLGRRILFFHTNLHILNQTPSAAATTESQTSKAIPESESPTTVSTVSSDMATYLAPSPFEHPHYKNLDAATYEAISEQCNEEVLARIAQRAGLHRVMRWVPAHATNLAQSGVDTVAVECLHAIIGAIALSRGGLEAKKFVNRLLQQRSLLE